MPKISLIVPIYNAGEYLFRCLRSIKEQTFDSFEVILVDDGSTDNSFEIMSAFANEDWRFKAFQKKNGGVSSARNYGLSKATGEWIAFVDADDWISPLFCQKMYQTAVDHNLDIVMCRRIDEKEDGSHRQVIFQKDYLRITSFEDFIPTEEDFYGTCWGFLFARSSIQSLSFDESIHFTEDALFTVEAMNKSSCIGILNEFLYHYNLTIHDSLSQGVFSEKKYTIIRSRLKQLDLFRGKCGESLISARLADACLYMYILGHETPDFMEKHYDEVNTIFKRNFKNWNMWRGGKRLKKYLRVLYRIDMRTGYWISSCIARRKE